MPNRDAKDRKTKKRRKNKELAVNGRTPAQIKRNNLKKEKKREEIYGR